MKTTVALFLFSISLAGCLTSPLLHHADEQTPLVDTRSTREKLDCPFLFSRLKLCAHLGWTKNPSDEEAGEFTLYFWEQGKGNAQNGPFVHVEQEVKVKLWMPSMGHGSKPPVKVSQAVDDEKRLVPGVYHARDVYFVMPGEWEIWIQLKKARDIIDEAKIDFNL